MVPQPAQAYACNSSTLPRRDTRDSAMLTPEHDGLMDGSDISSPFEQAAAKRFDSAPPAKPRKRLSALLRCTCFGKSPSLASVDKESNTEHPTSIPTPAPKAASITASTPTSSLTAAERPLMDRGNVAAVPARVAPNIYHIATANAQRQRLQMRKNSTFSDADWFDAVSHLDGPDSGSPVGSAAGSGDHHLVDELLEDVTYHLQDNQQQQQQQALSGAMLCSRKLSGITVKVPWIPDTPLLFAGSDLNFVPVPPHTGFAAYWEMDPARTTPHPQPIDIMINANFIVRRVHASIPGLWLQETDTHLTVTANPSFVPAGYPAYREVYDKSNETEPTWSPRRDMRLGHCTGKIYMTAEGMLVLRATARPLFSPNKIEYITEDYLVLEEGGQVVVDRMCCLCVATGRRAIQYQVGRRKPAPP